MAYDPNVIALPTQEAILSDFEQILFFVAVLAGWIALQRWILPKLGVPT